MKLLYFFITYLVLTGSSACAMKVDKETGSHERPCKVASLSPDRILVQQKISYYDDVLSKLNSPKIPELIKKPYQEYRDAYAELDKEIERDPSVDIATALLLITQQNGMFSNRYY